MYNVVLINDTECKWNVKKKLNKTQTMSFSWILKMYSSHINLFLFLSLYEHIKAIYIFDTLNLSLIIHLNGIILFV